MEVIIEIMENTEVSEEYFKILLGGLYGIATIVVAVMSIAANIINGKCLNMYVNKMLRFKITFSLSPIYYLVIYTFLIMKWSFFATNKYLVFVCVVGFLSLVTYCSYLTAQYVIDTERFQKKVLKVSIRKLKKEIKNKENRNSIIVQYMSEAYKNINTKDCRIFIDKKDREKLYNEYLELIDIETINDKDTHRVLEILTQEFEINKAFELCNNLRMGQLIYILLRTLTQESDVETMQDCIERMHSYIMYNALVAEKKDQYYLKINVYNKKAMISLPQYLFLTLQYIMNKEFAVQDAFYLAVIIGQIYDISEIIDLKAINFEKNTNTFLNKILEAKENFKWQENDSENDEAIRTALIMIGGIRNDK